MPIHLLPTAVASQIAAGEVVERPASVVKELLENSLDAGANQVSIRIEGAGQRLIEVSDNGNGIPADELPLAVERHATSKLSTAEDLFHITTLGFRGEALSSIGSVSRMTITSRTGDQEAASRLHIQAGSIGNLEHVGAPTGTVVKVEDLFYNVPARRKFLKQDLTERRHIDTLVTRYALAYPAVRFRLHQDGQPVLQTSGNGERREILAALYGPDIARQMLDVISEERNFSIRGYASPTSITRANRREMVFFVNGRPVQDAALISALLQAYHTLLMVGRYPQAILFLELPPEMVDVNVHPTKAEVRFRDSELVFTGVQRAVRRALLAHTPVPGLDLDMRWPTARSRPFDPSWERPATGWGAAWGQPVGTESTQDYAASTGLPTNQPPSATSLTDVEPSGTVTASQHLLQSEHPSLLRLVGQVASAYLVAEGPDGLYLIDQHAAHERVLFERFMAQASGTIPAQTLLQPATVELSAASARLLADQLPVLNRLGFQVENFGPNTFLVRACPALLTGSDPVSAIHALVEDFDEDETPLKAEMEARLVARICKRAAVKAGKSLTSEEQTALLHDLENCQSPRTCPHGRPTMIHLPVDLLERQFGRRGAR